MKVAGPQGFEIFTRHHWECIRGWGFGFHLGVAIAVAERRKHAAYPELMRPGSQRLCVVACDVGGRWRSTVHRRRTAWCQARKIDHNSMLKRGKSNVLQTVGAQILNNKTIRGCTHVPERVNGHYGPAFTPYSQCHGTKEVGGVVAGAFNHSVWKV